MVVHDKNDPRFAEGKLARKEELVKKGTHEFVKEDDIPLGAVAFQSRFVLTIKNAESSDQDFKARLVILGHVDPD